MAFPTGWTLLNQIRTDNTKVSGASDLSNFPVLIKDGNLPANTYSNIQSDGRDLRFTTDSAGTTEVAFEIVSITPASSLCEIWVKIPTLATATDTSLYIWGNNAGASAYAANAPFGSQAVWSGFRSVYHSENSSVDATATANGTGTDLTYSTSYGKIGQGASLNGSTSRRVIAKAGVPTGAKTVFMWVNPQSIASNAYIFTDSDNLTASVGFLIDSDGKMRLSQDSLSTILSTSTGLITTGSWYRIVFTISGTTGTIYLNGSSVGSGSIGTEVAQNPTFRFSGRYTSAGTGDAVQYTGYLDDASIISGAMTADWIATEYANQSSPSTFWITSSAYTSTLTETLTLVDSITKAESRTLSDVVTAVDTITRSISRSLLDYLTLVDLVSKGTNRTLLDSSTPSDSIAKSTNRTLTDVVTPSDSIIRSIVRTLTDIITPSDSIEKILNRLTSSIPTTIRHLANIKPFGFGKSVSEPRPSLKDNNKPSMM